jgi:hypothetical protein
MLRYRGKEVDKPLSNPDFVGTPPDLFRPFQIHEFDRNEATVFREDALGTNSVDMGVPKGKGHNKYNPKG